MRRASKIDTNHAAIADHLRRAGWSVHSTAPLGDDFPDLVVACGGFTAVVEAKTPGRKLTMGQEDFRMRWQGVHVVGRTPQQTLHDLERARAEAMA